jgi:hypothetical protein
VGDAVLGGPLPTTSGPPRESRGTGGVRHCVFYQLQRSVKSTLSGTFCARHLGLHLGCACSDGCNAQFNCCCPPPPPREASRGFCWRKCCLCRHGSHLYLRVIVPSLTTMLHHQVNTQRWLHLTSTLSRSRSRCLSLSLSRSRTFTSRIFKRCCLRSLHW